MNEYSFDGRCSRAGFSLLLCFVLVSPGAIAQTQLDISSCFNPLLQQQVDYSVDTRLALATLSQINESTYEASKHDVSLAAKYKILSGSVNYSDFDDKRRQYFQLNKLDLNYYQHISLSTRTLNSEGYGVIKSCIDTVASQQYGLHYLYTVDDPQTASVQFFWNPTEGGAPIEITDSVLVNAKVKTKDVPEGKLFPYVSRWSFTPYPKIQGASNAILLIRSDPTKNINITLTTKPRVKTYGVVIPPKDQPSIDLVCTTVYDTVDPATKQPYFRKEALVLNVTDKHGCDDCHGYSLAIDAPGLVLDVSCQSSGDHVWQEICDYEGSHIRSMGYQNANPRSMYISYHYKVGRQECNFPDREKQRNAVQGKGTTLSAKH